MLRTALLRIRQKIKIEEFCQEFYDSNIFRAIVAGTDLWSTFCESSFNLIVRSDPSFVQINRDLFRLELTALRMELFGLAWTHHLRREKYLLREIVFTKSYLEQNRNLDIWDIMREYILIIDDSTRMIREKIMEGEYGGEWFKIKMARRDSRFVRLLLKLGEPGVDGDWLIHVGSRLGSEVAWDKGITLDYLTRVLLCRLASSLDGKICAPLSTKTAESISTADVKIGGPLSYYSELAYRLGYSLDTKTDTLLKLSTILLGFYNGAKEAIQSVNLY